MVVSFGECAYLLHATDGFSNLAHKMFSIIVLAALIRSVLKLIQSSTSLHYLWHNTERTLNAMEGHLKLSQVISIFVSILTMGLLFWTYHHKQRVILDMETSINKEHHLRAAQNILDILSKVEVYVFVSLLGFYFQAYSFHNFHVFETKTVRRLVDTQAMK